MRDGTKRTPHVARSRGRAVRMSNSLEARESLTLAKAPKQASAENPIESKAGSWDASHAGLATAVEASNGQSVGDGRITLVLRRTSGKLIEDELG